MLPKEQEAGLFAEPSTGQRWYKQLFALLTEGCSFEDFRENKLSLVTFNYDRSLEYYLVTALHHLYSGKSLERCCQNVRTIKVIHIHGRLGRLPWEQADQSINDPDLCRPVPYGALYAHGESNLHDDSFEEEYRRNDLLKIAAGSIRIISETADSTEQLSEAIRLIHEASRVFILGFGFHPTNVKRLKLELLKQHKVKCTTHELSADRHKFLDKYVALTDFEVSKRSPSVRFDMTIDKFIQDIGLL